MSAFDVSKIFRRKSDNVDPKLGIEQQIRPEGPY